MKKSTLLNATISAAVARMGHTDMLTIGDCGLPIRGGAERIDLALTQGIPGFLATLDAILSELCVQRAILAQEIVETSPGMHQAILERLPNIPIDYISHEDFKKRTETTTAVVRTGECTAYANIILVSGVTF